MACSRFLTGCIWLLISSVCRAQTDGGKGLKGEYYNGWAFNQKVFTRTDRQVEFSWDGITLPGPGLNPQTFSIRWTGKVFAPVSGPYKFTAVVDDGIRIWVDGKLAMDEWRYRRQKVSGQSINLKAGQFYDLKIEYYNARAGGYVQLNWNLVDETGKTATFSADPQQKIGGQFLYNAAPKSKVPPVVKPVPVAEVIPQKSSDPAISKKPLVQASPPKSVSTANAKRNRRPPATFKPDTANLEPAPASSLSVATPIAPVNELAQQILFEQSDYRLVPTSYKALGQLSSAMQQNTHLHLVVAGHTDNVGDARLNKLLSENRARVVRNYLVSQGIADERITIVGYGGSQPVAPNDTEVDRAKNRRVELKLSESSRIRN